MYIHSKYPAIISRLRNHNVDYALEETKKGDILISYSATACLVKFGNKELLLTNHTIIAAPSELKNVEVVFSFQRELVVDPHSQLAKSVKKILVLNLDKIVKAKAESSSKIFTSKSLNYTAFALRLNDSKKFSPVYPQLTQGAPDINQVLVVHHPSGTDKRVDWPIHCKVLDGSILYQTKHIIDKGAPLLNTKGAFIGLYKKGSKTNGQEYIHFTPSNLIYEDMKKKLAKHTRKD